MPTINFSLKDFQGLLGKQVTEKELNELLEYCKGEVESINKDEATLSLGDTNLPYLWSIEGIIRLLKGVIGKEKGIAEIKINKTSNKIIVDKNIKEIRPFITGFIVKNCKLDEYLLKQLIQTQEILSENYGKKRKKISIGIYCYNKIKFPVHYKAVNPKSIKFIPLEFNKELDLKEILEKHPKGIQYKETLHNLKEYPILIDSKKEVLSFPPIINSNTSGKITIKEKDLFIEVTGTSEKDVNLVTNILAYVFYERKCDLYSCIVDYGNKKVISPSLENSFIKINKNNVESMIGIRLSDKEIKDLLEKARFEANNYKVKIPSYRNDILDEVDVIEDLGIMYGYNNLKALQLKTLTTGKTSDFINFIDNIRELVIGLNYQEIFSNVLSNKEILFDNMNLTRNELIEIENYMSKTYSSVRSWLLPILLDFLSKNKHVYYPQKLFEQGIVALRKDNKVVEKEKLCIVYCNNDSDFTRIKQVLDAIFLNLKIEYKIEETEHDSFITGRVAKIMINNRNIGYLGEIHPLVLNNFNLELPVCALEINLSELYEFMK